MTRGPKCVHSMGIRPLPFESYRIEDVTIVARRFSYASDGKQYESGR